MSLLERLNNDMKQAMRDKAKDQLSVIRMLKSSLQNEALKKADRELTEEEELTILSRELKQRKDSLQEFENAGRIDLVDKVRIEIGYVEAYMPKQLSEEEVSTIVSETIEEINASSKADMGRVMGALMPKLKGKADGSLINKLVQQHLS
ncbi:GatB/YqeY domain-containing protein [Peribacillus psychrosaccharolyticus]|uniref:GatB/YqeY domain-containing protein n=1 Tax=Peribacillus psychrosaccharolyticus TaxID=1407 RepID=A0A974NLG6_PERPY|nr:GatB/YqeY domain-containing protein [Peribacillus psychrosaccharolyticus]MEC2054335.1 GatB/YqeY domain-containing protein [Peribacillus psychrosaccharolyticus]MED3744437.1 GatB/YqeY domain-containing protein [Peribacillus psychrosaccharolyticus]QQS99908.1 GatB/YqeY domain-containing protein [Peribacillus psychrosaccharolyticus]